MSILEQAFTLLEKHPLCDHCLGRQFAALGRGVENDERGRALKLALTMQASALNLAGDKKTVKQLKVLAVNGFSAEAAAVLRQSKKRVPKSETKTCFLCDGKFQRIDALAQKALATAGYYEHSTFLVGIELPVKIEEREDEFKAALNVRQTARKGNWQSGGFPQTRRCHRREPVQGNGGAAGEPPLHSGALPQTRPRHSPIQVVLLQLPWQRLRGMWGHGQALP
jgi:hypothetical protein